MENAVLYVPVGMSRDNIDFICSSFEKKLARKLEFTVTERDDLLGGFIAKIDGKTYDNSLSSRFARMKKHLLKK